MREVLICLYRIKKVLTLVGTFFIVCHGVYAVTLINTIGYSQATEAFSTGDVAMGHLTFKKGLSIPAGGSIILDMAGILDGAIDLNIDGQLNLASDVHLGSTASFANGGYFNGNGHTVLLSGNLTLPVDQHIKIIGDLALDGNGNSMILFNNSSFQLSDNVTLTLKNMHVHCTQNSWPFELFGDASRLVLQDVVVYYDRNVSVSQGNLFVHDDVVFTGTSMFSYASTGTMYIQPSSTLLFDIGTTFSYSPGIDRRHALSERDNVFMTDQTSRLYLNGSTLTAPDSGMRLMRGSVLFENDVTINNLDPVGAGNTDVTKSIELGDGTTSGDVTTQVLAGARVAITGYVFDHTALS